MQYRSLNKKLILYVDYLNHLYGTTAGKKLFYLFLYHLIIPVVKVLAWVMRPVMGHISKEKLDLLVVGECIEDYTTTKPVWDILSSQNVRLKFVYNKKKSAFLKYPFFSGLSPCYPSKLYLNASYAKYLVEKYQPGVICSYKSYDTFPSLVRQQMSMKGKSVFIPHSVTSDKPLFSSFDFDYYFVFGESSIRNILKSPLRLGNTKIVKSGPVTFRPGPYLEPIQPTKTVLYFSNWLIGENKEITEDFLIVAEWAKAHGDYTLLIKMHQLENNGFVENYCSSIPNIRALPKSTLMKDALKQASMVILSYSNASLEASANNRPVVVVNHFDYDPESPDLRKSDSYLNLERFFPARAQNPQQMHERILEVTSNYSHYVDQCKQFLDSHCAFVDDPHKPITEILIRILHGEEDLEHTEVFEYLAGMS